MKKIGLIFLLLTLPIIQGCDPYFHYSVAVDEDAIITQNGEIVGGPITPGLHFKIPFLQEVHLIKTHRVRTIEFDLKNSPQMTSKFFWHIEDTIAFFKATQQGTTERELEDVIRKALSPEVMNLSQKQISELASKQKDDPYYSNEVTEKIIYKAQGYLTQYGIKARLFFRKKNA